MKKFIALSALLLAVAANASVIMTETFNYQNGSLIANQPGWGAHSQQGSGAQVVTNNHLRVVFNNQEDTDVIIPNNPYNGSGANLTVSSLYASMTLNFVQLPGSSNSVIGNYFAHFWDSSVSSGQTNGFRCRVFAYTNGAPDGYCYLGLTSVGGTVTNADFIMNTNTPLTTNVDYSLVLRLDVSANASSGTSQMWINPSATNSPSVTANGPGQGPVDIAHFCFRQVASFAGIVDVGKLKIGTVFSDVAGTNTPPNVSGLPSRIDTPMNVTTPAIPFTVTDDNTNNSANNITFSVTSTNTLVAPLANITLGGDGTGTNRTITIKPGTSRQGSSLITLNVIGQGGATNAVQILFVVGAPSISSIPNQIAAENSGAFQVPFQVSDHESAAGSLSTSATSANTAVVQNTGLVITNAPDGTNRVLTITPVAGVPGSSVITVTVRDSSGNTASTSFTFDVAQQYGVMFADNFDEYADGTSLSLVGDSQSNPALWHQFSGTFYQLSVTNQMAVINENQSEDIDVPLTNAPFATNSGAVIYYGFKLQVTKLPNSSAGEYFMLLKDTTTSGFRAKTFALTGGAAPGYFRLGVANSASVATSVYPQDLSPNSTYFVVVRYIVGSSSTTLWINPTSESSPSVTAIDAIAPQEIDRIAMRETQVGEGIEWIDNLVVSSAFSDVAPALIVSPIANKTTPVSTSTGPIPFIVTDKVASPDTCTYVGASDNQTVVPSGNISFGGSGTNRTVTIVPAAGQQGFANIAITVSDSLGNTNTAAFLLTVGNPPTNGVVISEVYPGGGNAGATYTMKFIELFNKTGNPVSLNNWSLQYASSTGSTWTAGNLPNVLVAPYSYYLVAIGAPGTNGAPPLPLSADYTLAGINPSQSVGKIALCNSQGPLSSATPLPNSTVVDFVGYGTGTSASEGGSPVAWTTDNTKSMYRASSGCTDTDNNAADFSVGAVVPRNSATAQNICSVAAPPPMRAFINNGNLTLAWPTSATGFNLETASAVNQNPWNVVSVAPTVVGQENQVTVLINGAAYFRLKK